MDGSKTPIAAICVSGDKEILKKIERTATVEFTDSQAKVEAQRQSKAKHAARYEEGAQTSTFTDEIAKASQIYQSLRATVRLNCDIKESDLKISCEEIVRHCERERSEALTKQNERSSLSRNITRITKSFCETATRMGGFLDVIVPSSPEYSIPYGLLKVLFKAVVDREQEREKVTSLMEDLAEKLPDAGFYLGLYRTAKIKHFCATLQRQVLDLFALLIEYCGLGRLSQLGNAIFPRKKYNFEDYMSSIEKTERALKRYVAQAILAKREDRDLSTEVLQEHSIATGKLILRHYELFKETSEATSTDIGSLQGRMSDMQKQMNNFINAQVSHRTYTLLNIFLPHMPPLDEELALWKSVSFQISQKEQWENTDLLEHISKWSREKMETIFLVSGQCGDRHPWITRFSVDLMLLLHNKDCTLAFAFCDRPPEESTWNTSQLVKILSYRLIEQNTDLLLKAPSKFNARSLRESQPVESEWVLLENIIELLKDVYLVVDRFECCEHDGKGDTGFDFIERLAKIVMRHRNKLHVIVTTTEEPATDCWDDETSRAISVAYVETRTAGGRGRRF